MRHPYPFPQTVASLAKQLGVSRPHLTWVLQRRALPSVKLAKKIEAAVGIKWQSWFEHEKAS